MSKYREMVRETGPAFLLLAFLARLPAAMVPLGVITLVASVTGSFATAGATAAAFGIGAAVGGPIVGSLADRFGQRAVGLAAAILNAIALAALVGAVFASAPTGSASAAGGLASFAFAPMPLVYALASIGAVLASAPTVLVIAVAAIAGFATPQVGPLVRVRWAALLERKKLSTAFSYEGAADELSYMAGPALVGGIALLGGAWLPLLIAAVLTLLAAVPFALHRTALPGAARMRDAARVPLIPVGLLIVAMVGIGVVFGSAQTGVTAFADELSMPAAAGLIYAALGIGSAVAGIATAWLPARISSVTKYVGSAVALAFGGLALLVAPSTPLGVTLAFLVVGVVSAPYLIAVYGLANESTPPARAGMVMTLLASGVVSGVALGAAVAGRLADTFGHAGAFTIPAIAGLLSVGVAAIFALATSRTRIPATARA